MGALAPTLYRPDSVYPRCAKQAISAAEYYFVNRRRADGLWYDCSLPPGVSEDWITAYVAWVLTNRSFNAYLVILMRAAARALIGARRAGGWGYNRKTSTDADSTAWVVRFLSAIEGSSSIWSSTKSVYSEQEPSLVADLVPHPSSSPGAGLAPVCLNSRCARISRANES